MPIIAGEFDYMLTASTCFSSSSDINYHRNSKKTLPLKKGTTEKYNFTNLLQNFRDYELKQVLKGV